MSQIQIEIADDVTQLLGDSPEQIKRSALEIIVLEFYRRHDISAGRAAELLDIDLLTFMHWLGSLGIPYFDMSDEEWQQELRAIEKA